MSQDWAVLYSDGAPTDPIRLGQLLVDESEADPLDMPKVCTDLSPVTYTSFSDGIQADLLASNNTWTGTNQFNNAVTIDDTLTIAEGGNRGLALYRDGTTLGGIVAMYTGSTTGTVRGYIGAAGANNTFITGSTTGDVCIRSEGGKIRFSADAGSQTSAYIDGTGQALALVSPDTTGDCYIGFRDSNDSLKGYVGYADSGDDDFYIGAGSSTVYVQAGSTTALTISGTNVEFPGNLAGNGYISYASGDSSNPGYFGFYTPDDTRRGYIGWNAGGLLELHAENSWGWYMSSPSSTAIYIQAGAGTLGFFGSAGTTKPTVSGSRGGNAALASLCTALAGLGLITDSTS